MKKSLSFFLLVLTIFSCRAFADEIALVDEADRIVKEEAQFRKEIRTLERQRDKAKLINEIDQLQAAKVPDLGFGGLQDVSMFPQGQAGISDLVDDTHDAPPTPIGYRDGKVLFAHRNSKQYAGVGERVGGYTVVSASANEVTVQKNNRKIELPIVWAVTKDAVSH